MTSSSNFKFLRRVRIHDGECGAVARALHHAVKGSSLYQADSRKALGSTNERKQMSTKTTLKRIALVAVSALGFGLLSVVPSNAAGEREENDIDSISLSAPVGARIGTDIWIGCTLTETGGDLDSTDTVSMAVAFVTDGGKPTGSTAADLDLATNSQAEGDVVETQTFTLGEYITFADFDGTATTSMTNNRCILLNADVAGTYKVVAWVDRNSGTEGTLDAGEKSGTVSVTVSGAVASLTVTKASPGTAAVSTASDDSSGNAITLEGGTLLKIVPKDTSGAVVKLTGQEYLSLASSDSSFSFYAVSDTGRNTAITSLAASNQEPDGSFYVSLVSGGSATETTVVTVTGSGAVSSTVTQTLSVTATKPTATDFTGAGNASTTDAGSDGYEVTAGTDDSGNVSRTAITHEVTGVGDAKITAIEVVDTYGFITGKYGATFTMAATASSAGLATFGITYARTPKAGETYQIKYLDDDDGATATLTIVAGITYTAAIETDPYRAVAAGTITLVATVTNELGDAIPGLAVTWSRT